MSVKSPLKYITLDQLMASVESDLSAFADNSMINRGNVIKVIRRVNEDLGLKIFPEKEVVLKIENYKTSTPVDFYKLQLAYLCGQPLYAWDPRETLGTVTQEFNENVPVNVQCTGNACINECGSCYWVTQLYKGKLRRFGELSPIRVTNTSFSKCETGCPNLTHTSIDEINIDENEIIANVKEGYLYLRYISDMADNENNLLVLDHPNVRDYYEYAVKKHLLENWMINNDADVAQKLIYIKEELKASRFVAINFISTIEPSEIKKIISENRNRFYNKYVKIIDP